MKNKFNIKKLKKLAHLLGIQTEKNISENELIDKIVESLSLTTSPRISNEYRLRYYSSTSEEEVTFLLKDLGAKSTSYNYLTKIYLKELANIKSEYLKTLTNYYYRINELNVKYLCELEIPFDKL